MTKIILVSATPFEIEPTRWFLESFTSNTLQIKICITGVGMVNTAFELGKLNGQPFDLAINAGIAGSFGAHKKGDVVSIINDCFIELGAEDDAEFLSIDALGFGTQLISLKNVITDPVTDQLPEANGVTVNTTHGNDISIKKITDRYDAGIETMEGAAFIHAANAFGWKALQLRAVSNRVEKRNKESWDIPLAIKNLNTVLIDLIKNLDEH